jgi:hypothetical protein
VPVVVGGSVVRVDVHGPVVRADRGVLAHPGVLDVGVGDPGVASVGGVRGSIAGTGREGVLVSGVGEEPLEVLEVGNPE